MIDFMRRMFKLKIAFEHEIIPEDEFGFGYNSFAGKCEYIFLKRALKAYWKNDKINKLHLKKCYKTCISGSFESYWIIPKPRFFRFSSNYDNNFLPENYFGNPTTSL